MLDPETLKDQIPIEQFIAEIRRNPTRPFWLMFVRSTGAARGTYKIVSRATYGAPKPGRSERKINKKMGEPRQLSLHIDRGTIPLTDLDTGEYLTPLLSHIVAYNLKTITHSNEPRITHQIGI